MPNTASAERRMRNSARRHQQNKQSKSRLKTLEKAYHAALATGKKDDADTAFRAVTSALDKAAKTGVIHSSTAHRKTSRLAVRLNVLK
jgi:small subunit ribosomal protein S20